MTSHRGVVAYEPSELVITARSGTPIGEILSLLDRNGQMLAFEPPLLGPGSTLGGVVASGFAGPRRPFSGGVRDSILGVKVLDGQGRVLRFGGTVFKNVAGFDGFRLMAGALGGLGVLLEVSLRVSPASAHERYLTLELDWPRAQTLIAELMTKPTPLSGAAHDGRALHLRLSGADQGVEQAASSISGEQGQAEVWTALRDRTLPIHRASRLWRLSVPRTSTMADLPGRWLRDWAGGEIWWETDAAATHVRLVAREAGGHATWYRGAGPDDAVFEPLQPTMLALHRRLKAAFDPHGILNPGRMYEGL